MGLFGGIVFILHGLCNVRIDNKGLEGYYYGDYCLFLLNLINFVPLLFIVLVPRIRSDQVWI